MTSSPYTSARTSALEPSVSTLTSSLPDQPTSRTSSPTNLSKRRLICLKSTLALLLYTSSSFIPTAFQVGLTTYPTLGTTGTPFCASSTPLPTLSKTTRPRTMPSMLSSLGLRRARKSHQASMYGSSTPALKGPAKLGR